MGDPWEVSSSFIFAMTYFLGVMLVTSLKLHGVAKMEVV